MSPIQNGESRGPRGASGSSKSSSTTGTIPKVTNPTLTASNNGQASSTPVQGVNNSRAEYGGASESLSYDMNTARRMDGYNDEVESGSWTGFFRPIERPIDSQGREHMESGTMHRRINYLQTKERQQEFEIGALLSETEKLARKVANLEAQTSNSSSSSKRRTIGYLQERLKDMLEAVGSLESPTKSSNSSKSMPMPADHLLAEMQEQLKLQKELHLRRKELEELMKKDLLEQSQMNEQRCGPPDSKDVSRWLIDTSLLASHPFFQQHSPPMSRQMSMSSSSFIPESNTTEEQLRSLQSQIDTLMADVRTLSTALQLQHNSSKGYTTEHLLVLYNRQEEKIQHLNQTVQRCLQELQRLNEVVPSLQNSVEKMIRQRMQSEQNRMNVEGEMGHWQDVNSSWPFQVAHSLSALNGNRHSDVDPSQNEVALNNQVLPGIRANNYWDLSRSFRYVNRLPNATSPGPIMTSAGSNVAQVHPRQHQSPAVDSRHDCPSYLDSSFTSQSSPARPKRKQNINREQNRESPSILPQMGMRNRVEGAAAMVIPMQLQSQNDRNINASHDSLNLSIVTPTFHPTAPTSVSSANHIVNTLTRSIYNQVNNLISQHEEKPEQLAKIFQNLQHLDERLESSSHEEVVSIRNPGMQSQPPVNDLRPARHEAVQDQHGAVPKNARRNLSHDEVPLHSDAIFRSVPITLDPRPAVVAPGQAGDDDHDGPEQEEQVLGAVGGSANDTSMVEKKLETLRIDEQDSAESNDIKDEPREDVDDDDEDTKESQE